MPIPMAGAGQTLPRALPAVKARWGHDLSPPPTWGDFSYNGQAKSYQSHYVIGTKIEQSNLRTINKFNQKIG